LFADNPKLSVQVTATDTTVRDLSALNLEGAVETYLADGITVGGTYDYNEANARPDELYIKKSFDVNLVREMTLCTEISVITANRFLA